ncbi:MAG: hypothetical protein KGV43_03440, partial [Arcobacter sp.]|nr:hypothetical protein [Arcobacter sp.]
IRVDSVEFTGQKTITTTNGVIPKIEVLNPEHADADYNFDISYVVVDTITDGTNTYTDKTTKNFKYGVTVEAITDTPTLTLNTDTVTVDTNDTSTTSFTKTLTLTSPDKDGSESFTRVEITGVPDGLDVDEGVRVGANTWYVDIDPNDVIGTSGQVTTDIVFKINGRLTQTADHPITIKAITQDGSASENSDTANFNININTTVTTNPGGTTDPAEIDTFIFKSDTAVTDEEKSFALGSNIEVVTQGNSAFSIKITSNDPDITISNATKIGNFWLIHGGGNQQAIIDKLDSIQVTPSEDFSTNNGSDTAQKLQLDVELTTHGTNGLHNHKTITNYDVVVKPLTDNMDFHGTTKSVSVNEDTPQNISISLANEKDGANVELVGNVVYIKADDVSLMETLKYGGVNILDTNKVTDPITDLTGDYYQVDLGASFSANTVDFEFTPKAQLDGNVSFDVYVPHKETHNISGHDSTTLVSKQTVSITINAVADDPTIATPQDVKGDEDTMIEVPINATIPDSSEEITNMVIKGIPNGYLVFYGANATSATQADNLGGEAWSMGYAQGSKIFIKPPENKSDDITGVTIEIISDGGKTGVTTPAFDITINPIADGLEMSPTKTFGSVGEDVSINLNANMIDIDGSESVTLTFKGFGVGENISFNAGTATYDEGTDTYTIEGITPDELGSLAFSTLFNVSNDVTVTAKTIETDANIISSVETGTFNVSVTGGTSMDENNTIVFDPARAVIDTGAGEDTLKLSAGAQDFGDIANIVKNIEIIDLSLGNTTINNLSVADVAKMTSGNKLTIKGGSQSDSVDISSSEWGQGTEVNSFTTFTKNGVTLEIQDEITKNII